MGPTKWYQYSIATCVAISLSLSGRASAAERYALLVGCTKYVELPASCQLAGPANDVALLQKLLLERFGFKREDMTLLTEAQGNKPPTRENIRLGFAALAKKAQTGDQIVILLAGHGSRQPVPENNDWIKNYEPDGLDQVFCPRDVGDLEANQSGQIANGIVDNEIGQWLGLILEKGACVWLICDACHSATMIRGNGVERPRAIPSDTLLPQAKLIAAQKRVAGVPRPAGPPSTALPSKAARFVALYACQVAETEPEGKFPLAQAEDTCQGLLTFALVKSLNQRGGPMTYRELAQEIYSQYVAMGRVGPTPLVEGTAIDQFILDESHLGRRVLIQLNGDRKGDLKINAGAVHGLTEGSILAVYPPPRDPQPATPLGHVVVKQLRVADASVVPCAYEGAAVRADLPQRGRCEVVVLDCGLGKLRFAVDDRDGAGQPISAASRSAWYDGLRSVTSDRSQSVVRLVDQPAQADWLVRLDGKSVQLVPSSGWSQQCDRGGPPALQAAAGSATPYKDVKTSLEAIARATNLVRLASQRPDTLRAQFGEGLRVEATLLLANGEGEKAGKDLTWQAQGRAIPAGTRTLLRIENRESIAVDVTALYVDSQYGITPIFPDPGRGEANRIEPQETRVIPGDVNDQTVGMEHIIVLAVRSEPLRPAVDLSVLRQPPLAAVVTQGLPQDSLAQRGGQRTPLEELLSTALDSHGTTRGFSRRMGRFASTAISFEVVSKKP